MSSFEGRIMPGLSATQLDHPGPAIGSRIFFDVITCYFMLFTAFFANAFCYFMLFSGVFVVFRPGHFVLFAICEHHSSPRGFSSRFHLPCPLSCDSCHSPVRHRLGDGGWADLPVLLVSAFPLSRFPIWLRLRRAVSLPSFRWICLNLPQMALD